MSAHEFILPIVAIFIFCISETLSSHERTVHEYSPRIWYTASLTPYEVIGNLDGSPITYSGYKPLKLWFVGRHGTRYPETKTLHGMFHVLPEIRKLIQGTGNKCFSEELRDWFPATDLGPGEEKSAHLHASESDNITIASIDMPSTTKKFTKSMTLQGRTTMEVMGVRFRERFGDFIPTELDSRIEVRFTKTLRTKESAISFLTGLLGEVPPEDSPYFYEATPPDYALKFSSFCPFWKKYIKWRPEWKEDFEAFKNGSEMNRVLKNVQERCSLPGLDQDTLRDIYMMCSYELAWYDESPWCKFFEEDELEVLEYFRDVKYFNVSAYSNEWNYKIACPMVKQMFEFLTTNPEVPVRLNFSHLGSLMKFSSRLGLFPEAKEEWLTGRDYRKKVERKWATSRFAGFSFNFTFVLYESDNHKERAVLFLLNENVVKIPGCPEDADLCPLERFEEIFYESIHKCEYEKWCSVDEPPEGEPTKIMKSALNSPL